MNSYKSLCTQFYDIDKPTAPADALEFYSRYAREADGPIFEPMCGSGRFLVPMLQAGFDIDGFDASPQMLAACRDKLSHGGLRNTVSEQFLHEMRLSRRYKFVFIPAGSFNLITDLQHVRESLRRIYDALLPSGKFVFESGWKKPKESSSWPWGGRWIDRPDGARMIISWLGRYDAATSLGHDIHRYDVVRDCQIVETEVETFDRRFYDLAEMKSLLAAAGLVDIVTWKAYAHPRQAHDEGNEDIVFECARTR